MKRLTTLILICCLASVHLLGQDLHFYGGGGFNLFFPQIKNLDYVIDRYNGTRNYLDVEMKQVNLMKGGHVVAGFILDNFLVEMGWTGNNRTVFSEGVSNNIEFRRELKVRNNVFNMSLGASFGNDFIKPGFLVGFNFGNFRSFTRIAEASAIDDEKFDGIHKELNLGVDVAVVILIMIPNTPVGFAIRPYYRFSALEYDYAYINYAINPNTAPNDDYVLGSRPKGFGLQFDIILMTGNR